MEQTDKVMVCLHCGNKTQMKFIYSYTQSTPELEHQPGYGEILLGVYNDDYRLYQCPVCDKVSLEQCSTNSYEIDENGSPYEEIKKLYPPSENMIKRLPKGVKEAFDSAVKVRYIDGAVTALALRRTLEKMCKDKGAKGKDLYHKLKFLSDNGIIPTILSDMSSVIRDIGNEAAHADEVDFPEDLVRSLFKFTEIILEYVYVLPRHLKEVQFDLSLRDEKETTQ